jgi:hypothetical protein
MMNGTTYTGSQKQKNVLIPMSLFIMLVKYFLFGKTGYEDTIRDLLEEKTDRMLAHEYYGRAKNALTEKERGKAMNDYWSCMEGLNRR